MLMILDGFGLNPSAYGNAVAAARTPNLDAIFAKYPHIKLAAKLDGASGFQRLARITLPSVKNGTFIVVVLAILNSFKVFREVYLVAGDYPHDSIYMIQHLFHNWFRELELNKLAAGAVIDSVVLIILILFLQKCWKKGGTKL